MACRLFGAKPLPEPTLTYYQLDPQESTSVKFESKYKTFHSWKCIWKRRLQKGGHFVRGRWVDCDYEAWHGQLLYEFSAWKHCSEMENVPMWKHRLTRMNLTYWALNTMAARWHFQIMHLLGRIYCVLLQISLTFIHHWSMQWFGMKQLTSHYLEQCLTHWSRDKMAANFQTTFSNAFSWMKMCNFLLRFHWNLFPGVQ